MNVESGPEEPRIAGVFKGGGAKGALYAGAMAGVEKAGVVLSEVAGSSAGAITAAFVAAGATPEDLEKIEERSRELLTLPSGVRSALALRTHLGVLSFDSLRRWIADELNRLCARHLKIVELDDRGPTFRELEAAGGKPLHVASADLRWRAPVVFNATLTPDLRVADAAASSSAIPFVFETPLLPIDDTPEDAALILVSDGGVMANLPTFIFTDDGYRKLAGIADTPAPDHVIGFSFVDADSPLHTSGRGAVGDLYRERYAAVRETTTFSLRLVARLEDRGLKAMAAWYRRRDARKRKTGWIRTASFALLNAVARTIEIVVLPPLNVLLGWAVGTAAVPAVPERISPRVRRWLTFADRVFGLAPGYVVAGIVMLIAVFVFGLPDVVRFIWPDWSGLLSDATGGEVVFRIFVAALWLLLAGLGLLLVIVLALVGLGAYLGGWVTKPVASLAGRHLVATFLRNPQEPLWAGQADNETLIRIRVPEGWSLLKATTDDEKMRAELVRVRSEVVEQLADAGFRGTSRA